MPAVLIQLALLILSSFQLTSINGYSALQVRSSILNRLQI